MSRSVPSGAAWRLLARSCGGMAVLGLVLAVIHLAMASAVGDRGVQTSGWLALVVVGALEVYLGLRLWPLARLLRRAERGAGEAPPGDWQRSAERALLTPVAVLWLGLLASVGLVMGTGWVALKAPGLPPTALGLLSAVLLPVVAGGVGGYLLLRWALQEALLLARPVSAPVWRFGLTARISILLVGLPLAAVGVIGWMTSRAELTLLLVAGGKASAGGGGMVRPALLVALGLALAFAGLTGVFLAAAIRGRARRLTARLSRMALEDSAAALERLPLHAATEAAPIAAAFNRLADRLDDERERLAGYAETVQRTEQMRGQFLRNVSHELRTPLNAILGFSDLLLTGLDGPLTEPQRRAVLVISDEGERLLWLINDILLMARFEAGRAVLQPSRFGLTEWLDEVAQEARRRGVRELEVCTSSGVLPPAALSADRGLLLRAASALAEYAGRQGAAVTLQAEVSAPGGFSLRVEVAGECPGPEQRARLFDGFRQADPTASLGRRVQLGLPLARRIAGLHGGELRFEEGPTLRLSLDLPPATWAADTTGDPFSGIVSDPA